MRVKCLLIFIMVGACAVSFEFLLVLQSLFHERVFALSICLLLQVRLYKVSVELLYRISTLCFLLYTYLIVICATVIAGVSTQSTILIGRIPNILLIFIFDDHFFEEVVCRISRFAFLERVRMLVLKIIALFIGSCLLFAIELFIILEILSDALLRCYLIDTLLSCFLLLIW